MQNINSVINLLADKNCNNCRHFFKTWCGQDHNKESICDGTCDEWTEKDSGFVGMSSIGWGE